MEGRRADLSCDVLVVGAGLVGAWTAYFLSQLCPHHTVRVVEQATAGGGASGASAGYDAVESGDPFLRALAHRSRELYRRLGPMVPAAVVERPRNTWITKEQDALSFASRFGNGEVGLRRLAITEVPSGFVLPPHSAVFEEEYSGFARPGEVARALLQHLVTRYLRVSVHEGTRVVEIESGSEGPVCYTSDGRRMRAGLVVLTTGAYPEIAGIGPASYQPFRRKKVASLVVDSMPPINAAAVVYHSADCFFLPVRTRRHWLFCFNVPSWDVPWRDLASLSALERAVGIGLLDTLRPDFADLAHGTQVGYDMYTVDRRPKAVAAFPGGWLLSGFSGGGYRWAPAFAEQFVQEVVRAER